jgi:hypothetical protein
VEPWALYVVSLAVIVVAFAPLWSGLGLLNDDYPAVYLRIHQYFQEFRHGHLPAVLPDVLRGGGSAFPQFYPPLAYYVGAGIYGLTGDMVWAGHLAAFLSLVLSAVAMTWAARQLGVPPAVALVAGLAYATFPYRFTNVLVRGALAESWALVWLPLVFASAVRVVSGVGSGLALAVTTGLLVLTHTGLALWALPAIVGAAAFAYPKGRLAATSVVVAAWVLAGVGLAAWYLLPMWYYLPTVRASDPEVMFATANEFSLWRVEWLQAFGFDRLLVNPQTGRPLAAPMALSIGLSSLVLATALCLLRTAYRSATQRAGSWFWLAHGAVLTAVLLLFVAIYPKLVSSWAPGPLLYLQFPYRLMGIVAMLATTATALVLGRVVASRAGAMLLVVWGVVVGGTAAYEASQPGPPGHVGHKTLLALLYTRDKGLTARYEYLPRTDDPEAVGTRIEATRTALRARATALLDTTNQFSVTIPLAQRTRVVLPRVAYPFLRVTDASGRDLRVGASDGLLALDLPAGIHTLTVRRRIPWPTALGILSSLLTAGAVALLTWRRHNLLLSRQRL